MRRVCVVAAGAMLAGVGTAKFGAEMAEAQTVLPPISVATPVAPPKAKAKAAPKAATKTAPVATPEEPATAAAAASKIAEDTFVAVTVVPTEEILSTPGANLTDSLQLKPGISGSTFAPGANRPIIRGLDNNRVLVQENGIGSHDVSALSEDHAVPIDPLVVDRIEVVRGPATLRYGSQAIGGVVNAVTGRIPEIIPPKGVSFATYGGLTSGNDGADGAFKVTAGSGNVAVYADAFKRHAGDYDTPQGRQLNTFVDSEGFAVGTSFVGTNGYVGVAFSRYGSTYGIPGEEAEEHRPYIDLNQDKVQARGEWRLNSNGIEAVRFWLGSSWYEHDEWHSHEGETEVGSHFSNQQTEGRLEIQHMPVMTSLGELRGAAGVQFGHKQTRGSSFEEVHFVYGADEQEGIADNLLDRVRTSSVAAFWFEELQLTSRLRLQAATRLEQTSVDGTGLELTGPDSANIVAAKRTFMPLSGSTGFLYDLPGGVVARLTGQYVERAPADAELFSKGMHEATGTFEIGNPYLEKEVAKTVELGFRKATGSFRFDASAYYTRFDGFIYKGLTGAECFGKLEYCNLDPTLVAAPAGEDEPESLAQVLYQQRDATFYGVELQGEQDIGRVWRGVWGIDAQYDFVRAQFDDAQGGNVPRIPPHRAGAGIYYRDANWAARLGFLHAFDQDRVGENEEETKGYTLVNADLAYTFKLDGSPGLIPEMTIGLKAENLLDDDVRNHVSFKAHEVLQPGRTFRLYGTVKLN